MAYEQKDMSGAIFKNDKKASGSNQPDRKGDCMIDGKAYWVSGWLKDGKRGQFLSLSFKPKDEKPASIAPRSRTTEEDFPSDLPF
ncbi:MAG TPA: hypothetical protein VHV32_19075 [Candidatus Angelobacter sp.]|jgi:hypothetical protein|nr:hypothetical protein [Candidatus Angelobacter sp.]